MSSNISSLESLNGLMAFATAVETGGFSAAGRRLGLSSSAVGKAVDRLEMRLGMRLLNRSTRALALTGAGEVLYQYAIKILRDLQDAEREMQLQESTPRGHLKVSVPPMLGRRFVLPALRDFQQVYPEVMACLSFDNSFVDIIDEGYDLALWPGELEDSSLQARRLGPMHMMTCAAPRYFAEHGKPQSLIDLAQHCWIRFRRSDNKRMEPWRFRDNAPLPKPRSSISFNDAEAMVVTAVAGWGIMQAPEYTMREDLQAGRLEPILQEYAWDKGGISFVWPAHAARAPRVRAFIDFMSERLIAELYPQPGMR